MTQPRTLKQNNQGTKRLRGWGEESETSKKALLAKGENKSEQEEKKVERNKQVEEAEELHLDTELV